MDTDANTTDGRRWPSRMYKAWRARTRKATARREQKLRTKAAAFAKRCLAVSKVRGVALAPRKGKRRWTLGVVKDTTGRGRSISVATQLDISGAKLYQGVSALASADNCSRAAIISQVKGTAEFFAERAGAHHQ